MTYIDVHRPPTSWVYTVHGHRDIGWWPKFRGSPKPLIWVVRPNSRYLNLRICDFLDENASDADADKARHSWGNFQTSHKWLFEMHIGGTVHDEWYSKMWVLQQLCSRREYLPLPSFSGPPQNHPQRSQGTWRSIWKLSGILWSIKVIMIFSPGSHIWYPSYITP